MYIGCGNCHDPFKIDHYATVATDTDKLAFHALEYAIDNAHTGAPGDIQFLGFEVENGLVVVAGDQHETAHLRIGDGHGLMFLAVHDATDGKDVLQIVLQLAQKGTAGTDKDQVVDGRHELAHTTLLLHDVFVAHRDKVFYAGFVKILFECQFATVGDTNGIPM